MRAPRVHHAARRRGGGVAARGAGAAARASAAHRRAVGARRKRPGNACSRRGIPAGARQAWMVGGPRPRDRLSAGAPEREPYAGSRKRLIGATPDVIVAESTPAAAALRQETPTVSIVFLQVGDPVGSRLRREPGASRRERYWASPISNTTMGGKWLELLKEIAPPVTRASPSCQSRQPIPASTGRRGGGCAIVRRGIQASTGSRCRPGSRAPWQTWRATQWRRHGDAGRLHSHTPRVHRCARSPPSLAVDLSVPRFRRQRRLAVLRN